MLALTPLALSDMNLRQTLFTYWTLKTRGMVNIELPTGLGLLLQKAYFLFVQMQINGSLGGLSLAIYLY